ncbi:MAG: hypothetical protein IT425_04795 [Pirellulales bacterium]|nr:hypothetical protein [Pirellulales bacterium]
MTPQGITRFSFFFIGWIVAYAIAGSLHGAEPSSARAKEIEDSHERSLLRVAELPEKPEAASSETKKYDLRYKLKRGDVLRYEVTHRASIRSTVDETTQAAQTKTDSVKAWKVTDTLPNGNIEFTNVVEKVHMVNQLPDRDAVEYNSEVDKVAPPGFEDAARAVGVPLSTMQITPCGKVVRRDTKTRNQNAESDAAVALRLPEGPVAMGDTWDEPFEVQVTVEKTNTKTIQTRRHHKLTAVENGIATIEVTYQVLSPIDPQIETQIVQRLMEGEVRFDIERGRVVGQRMDIDKRIIGFAGPTSSMQYIMKMEELLVKDETKPPVETKTAARPSTTTKRTSSAASNRGKTPHSKVGSSSKKSTKKLEDSPSTPHSNRQ